MISRDRGQRGPVEAVRELSLLREGPSRTQPLLMTGPRGCPELLERGDMLAVESLDREDRDVPMLGIDPGIRPGDGEKEDRKNERGDAGSLDPACLHLSPGHSDVSSSNDHARPGPHS